MLLKKSGIFNKEISFSFCLFIFFPLFLFELWTHCINSLAHNTTYLEDGEKEQLSFCAQSQNQSPTHILRKIRELPGRSAL
jgi:hypothetical protein